MQTRTYRGWPAACLVIVLSGCAARMLAIPRLDDTDSQRIITAGQTTREEVLNLLGPPTRSIDNGRVWVWVLGCRNTEFNQSNPMCRWQLALIFNQDHVASWSESSVLLPIQRGWSF